MKKIFFLLVIGASFILISCEGGSKESDKNLKASHDIYKGIETGDTALLALADESIDHSGPNGELKGGAAIRAMLVDIHTHFKDLKMNVESEAANGDMVFSLIRMTGTATDDKMGVKAGTSYDSKSVDVVKFKDGKAVEHWGFMDMAEMMKMMPPATMPMPANDMKKDSMQ